MKKALSYLVVILISAACASEDVKSEKSDYLNQPVEKFSSIDEAYRTYNAGIWNIFANVSDEVKDREDASYRLSIYKSMCKGLGWSYVDNDDQIYAIKPGCIPGYWVSFINLDHPALATRGPTLHAELNPNNFVAVIIRPDRISERWAGLFLLHELAHGREYLDKIRPDKEKTEFIAYDTEKVAYNYLTRSQFDKVLDEVINRNDITGADMLIKMGGKGVSKYLDEINEKMGEDFGHSLAEMEMRYGFYLMAMVLRLSENRGDNDIDKTRILHKVIESYSLF